MKLIIGIILGMYLGTTSIGQDVIKYVTPKVKAEMQTIDKKLK